VVIVGFPTASTRDTFYWTSQEGRMDVSGAAIRSRLVGRGIKLSQCHFFYMSPQLYAREGALTQHEDERKRHVDETALPTKIFAKNGTLLLSMGQNRITGQIVMHGLDPLGRDYVQYTASFVGTRSRDLQTKR